MFWFVMADSFWFYIFMKLLGKSSLHLGMETDIMKEKTGEHRAWPKQRLYFTVQSAEANHQNGREDVLHAALGIPWWSILKSPVHPAEPNPRL